MSRRRSINGALQGLLGTLLSRYSDFRGYWVFGFLAVDREEMTIDLRSPDAVASDASPRQLLESLARHKFLDQLSKWRIPSEWIADARLDVRWSENAVEGFVNDAPAMGSEVILVASVDTDLGRTFALARKAFAAPHNPRVEIRSARAA
jgi:hypothetical protein